MMEKTAGKDEQVNDTYAVVAMPEQLKKNEKIIILTANYTEDLEFFYPYYRLTEAGYTVDVVTPEGGKFEAKHGLGLSATQSIAEVKPQDYVLLYIPGGKAPETLRKNEKVLNFVKEFASSGKPIAAICHGPQVLISAGLVKGKQIAAWPEVEKEIEAAGGFFVNEALVEDGQFITARKPGDLHRHLYGILDYLRGNLSSHDHREHRKAS
jgi:protease I